MRRPTLSLLASIALAAPFALHSPSTPAAQEPPVPGSVNVLVAEATVAPVLAVEALHSHHLLDEDELAVLAALESQHVELQEQKAGFFGPRIGTVLIVALLVVLLL